MPSTNTSALLTTAGRFLLTSIHAAHGLPEQASLTARNSNMIVSTAAPPRAPTEVKHRQDELSRGWRLHSIIRGWATEEGLLRTLVRLVNGPSAIGHRLPFGVGSANVRNGWKADVGQCPKRKRVPRSRSAARCTRTLEWCLCGPYDGQEIGSSGSHVSSNRSRSRSIAGHARNFSASESRQFSWERLTNTRRVPDSD